MCFYLCNTISNTENRIIESQNKENEKQDTELNEKEIMLMERIFTRNT